MAAKKNSAAKKPATKPAATKPAVAAKPADEINPAGTPAVVEKILHQTEEATIANAPDDDADDAALATKLEVMRVKKLAREKVEQEIAAMNAARVAVVKAQRKIRVRTPAYRAQINRCAGPNSAIVKFMKKKHAATKGK